MHAALPGAEPLQPLQPGFRNPLYLGSRTCPSCARPRGPGPGGALAAAGRGLLDQDRIDRPAVYRLKDEALRLGHGALDRVPAGTGWPPTGRHPNLERFATFCALQHVHGNDWRDWPASLTRLAGRWPTFGAGRREVGYHAWLQWLLDEQLAAVRPGRAAGVVNDLAIGFAPNGFDAWSFQDELAAGMSVGAPPDPGPTARTGACRRSCPTGWPPAATGRSPRPSGPAWPTPPACASTT